MALTAIQTVFKGHLFRSRLEARWAVFFDQFIRGGLKWEYEPEGFDLDGIYYLPDFRVTNPQGQVTWYEVKPENGILTPEEHHKLEAFHNALNARLPDETQGDYTYMDFAVLRGDPYHLLMGGHAGMCPRCGSIHPGQQNIFSKDEYINCFLCDMQQPDDRVMGLLGTCIFHKGLNMLPEEAIASYLYIIEQAATIARSARFEHGQTPISTGDRHAIRQQA